MENIEENVVTKGAAKADPMPSSGIPVEDLGGPTPENYKPDDDSAKLKDPASPLAQVKDVVNAKAMKAEEAETEEEVIEEEVRTSFKRGSVHCAKRFGSKRFGPGSGSNLLL